VLDVGAAEGYLPHILNRFFGAKPHALDLSSQACRVASELFSVPSVSANASLLPFATDSFDVVVMTEVAEHLTDP
jgi:2-polyprenyl-3-methyl-5-hydroxy-6-metoxy-1,4-benzoquinol methylase